MGSPKDHDTWSDTEVMATYLGEPFEAGFSVGTVDSIDSQTVPYLHGLR